MRRSRKINEYYDYYSSDVMTIDALDTIGELVYYISYHGDNGDIRDLRRFERMKDNEFSIETDAGMYLDNISFKEVKQFMQRHDNTMYLGVILDLKNFKEFVEWYRILDYYRYIRQRDMTEKKKMTRVLRFVKQDYPHLLKVAKKHL